MTAPAPVSPARQNLIVRYRWELLLLLVIPLIAAISRPFVLLAAFVVNDTYVNSSATAIWSIGTMGISIVAVLLLLAFFRRVRRQGRKLLTLIYVYFIATWLITILVALTQWTISDFVTDSIALSTIYLTAILLFIEFAVALPITLWFARQASAMGLAYAYFLVLIGRLTFYTAAPTNLRTVLESYVDFTRAQLSLITLLISFVASVIIALVGVWLLGNFELRGSSFRKRVVVALYAYTAYTHLGGYILLSLYLGAFISILAPLTVAVALALALEIWLIYRVRIRQPAVPSMP